ncbi:9590_t:CDS:2 [Funneliformis mosseae]|uniref:9590_t:CDS:1 n=1 Tax=Funneliformis mosseae TaxID=27381 RepID=A0A9N8V645_FUNMO|nr:9590_t:CDS:2 [Funneliformis mosseae]
MYAFVHHMTGVFPSIFVLTGTADRVSIRPMEPEMLGLPLLFWSHEEASLIIHIKPALIKMLIEDILWKSNQLLSDELQDGASTRIIPELTLIVIQCRNKRQGQINHGGCQASKEKETRQRNIIATQRVSEELKNINSSPNLTTVGSIGGKLERGRLLGA